MLTRRLSRPQIILGRRQWRLSPRRYATVDDILASDKLVASNTKSQERKEPGNAIYRISRFKPGREPIIATKSKHHIGSAPWWAEMDAKHGPNFEAKFVVPEAREYGVRLRELHDFGPISHHETENENDNLPDENSVAAPDLYDGVFSDTMLRKRAERRLFMLEVARLGSIRYYSTMMLLIGPRALATTTQFSLHVRLLLRPYVARPVVLDLESPGLNQTLLDMLLYGTWIKNYANVCLHFNNLLLRHMVDQLGPSTNGEPVSTPILPLLNDVFAVLIHNFQQKLLTREAEIQRRKLRSWKSHVSQKTIDQKAVDQKTMIQKSMIQKPRAAAMVNFGKGPVSRPVAFLQDYQSLQGDPAASIRTMDALKPISTTLAKIFRQMDRTGDERNVRLLGQAENVLHMALTIDGDLFPEPIKKILQQALQTASAATMAARKAPQEQDLNASLTVRQLSYMVANAERETRVAARKIEAVHEATQIVFKAQQVKIRDGSKLEEFAFGDAIEALREVTRERRAKYGDEGPYPLASIIDSLQTAQAQLKAAETSNGAGQVARSEANYPVADTAATEDSQDGVTKESEQASSNAQKVSTGTQQSAVEGSEAVEIGQEQITVETEQTSPSEQPVTSETPAT